MVCMSHLLRQCIQNARAIKQFYRHNIHGIIFMHFMCKSDNINTKFHSEIKCKLLTLSSLADAKRIAVQPTLSVGFLQICSTMMLFSNDCVEVVYNSYVWLLRIADTLLCEEAFTFEARQERIPVI